MSPFFAPVPNLSPEPTALAQYHFFANTVTGYEKEVSGRYNVKTTITLKTTTFVSERTAQWKTLLVKDKRL